MGEPNVKSAFGKLLLILTLSVIGIGFYRGWFTVASRSLETPTKQVGVSLTVDQDKVSEDARRVKAEAAELTGKVTEEAKELEVQVKDRSRIDKSPPQ
jgi:hypothetical protein